MTDLQSEVLADAEVLIELALREDLADVGDLSSRALIPESAVGIVHIAAREDGVVSGLPIVERVFAAVESHTKAGVFSNIC